MFFSPHPQNLYVKTYSWMWWCLRWGLREVIGSWEWSPQEWGLAPLEKRPLLPRWEHSGRTAAYAPESGLSPDTESAVALISDFQPRKLGEVNVCHLSPQVYGSFVLVGPMGLDRDTLKRTKGKSLKAVYFESIRFSKTSIIIHFIRPPRVWVCNSYESQTTLFRSPLRVNWAHRHLLYI